MGVSVLGAIVAWAYASSRYNNNKNIPLADTEERPALTNLSYNKFYIDEIYDTIIRKPLDALSVFFYKVVDQLGIDGLVNGLGKGSIASSRDLRLLQSGNVGFYVFMMVIGVIAVLVYNLIGF